MMMSQNNRRTATYQGDRTCLAFPTCTAVASVWPAGGSFPPSSLGTVLFKCGLCLLITKWNAGRTSSYPILSYFTGFLYNKDIFPESIARAGNYNRPVQGGGRKADYFSRSYLMVQTCSLWLTKKIWLYYVIQ